ncbi:hypothetical protein ACO0QE_002924 [Hanseniaspora vineae]
MIGFVKRVPKTRICKTQTASLLYPRLACVHQLNHYSTATSATTKLAEQDLPFGLLSLKIGKIVDIQHHENADSMYVEQIDTGKVTAENVSEPIQVCSGLKNFIPINALQDSLVVVVENLKPSKLRGIKSYGMLLCGSDTSNAIVQTCKPDLYSNPSIDTKSLIGQQVRISEKKSLPPKKIKSKDLENILSRLYVGDNNQVVFNVGGTEHALYITPKESDTKIPIVVDNLPRGTKVY